MFVTPPMQPCSMKLGHVLLRLALLCFLAWSEGQEVVTWTFVQGGLCPLYTDATMEWNGDEEACKARCRNTEGCKGFVRFTEGPAANRCFGRTDTCEISELELDLAAVTYSYTTGTIPICTLYLYFYLYKSIFKNIISFKKREKQ